MKEKKKKFKKIDWINGLEFNIKKLIIFFVFINKLEKWNEVKDNIY